MSHSISDLGITCSASSKFYVCDDKPSQFIGCCTSDPCATADGVCPDTNLESASFDPEKWSDIPPQACASSDPETLWYTCRDSDPTYMGCCTVNACTPQGCPVDKVRAARLSDRADDAAVFLFDATSTTTITATAATQTSSADSNNGNNNNPSDGMSKGATIGISVTAAIIGLAIIGALFYWVIKRLLASNDDDNVPDFPHEEPYYGTSPEPRDSKYGDSISIQLRALYPDSSSSPALPQDEYVQHEHQQELQAQPQDFAVTITAPGMGGDSNNGISELPATTTMMTTTTADADHGIQSGDEGDAGRHLVSMSSLGATGRESLVSMQTPPPLEEASSRH